MTTPEKDPQDDHDGGVLGSAVSEPLRPRPGAHPEPAKGGEDGVLPQSMAGPVWPPEETEPDAQRD